MHPYPFTDKSTLTALQNLTAHFTGSTVTIGALIMILLILIVIFKT